MGDLGSIPGLGRSPGEGHGNPLQYSCLENPHEQRSLVGYSPCGHKESDTTEQLTLFLDHQCLSVCSVAGTVWVLGICQGRKQRKIPAFMELQGFTGGSDGKESVMQETWV